MNRLASSIKEHLSHHLLNLFLVPVRVASPQACCFKLPGRVIKLHRYFQFLPRRHFSQYLILYIHHNLTVQDLTPPRQEQRLDNRQIVSTWTNFFQGRLSKVVGAEEVMIRRNHRCVGKNKHVHKDSGENPKKGFALLAW